MFYTVRTAEMLGHLKNLLEESKSCLVSSKVPDSDLIIWRQLAIPKHLIAIELSKYDIFFVFYYI